MFIIKPFILLTSAAFVAAWPDLDSNVSPGCASAIESLLANNQSVTGCLGLDGFAELFSIQQGQDFVPALNDRFTTICTSPVCDPADIAATSAIIRNACAADTENLGYPPALAQGISTVLSNYYGTFLEVACLKNSTTGNYCLTENWYALEGAAGTTLSLHDLLAQTIVGGLSLDGDISDINLDITCNECNAAAFDIVSSANISAFTNSATVQSVDGQCAAYVYANIARTGPNADGSIPNGGTGDGVTPPSVIPPTGPTEGPSVPTLVPSGTDGTSSVPTIPVVPTGTASAPTTTDTAVPAGSQKLKARALGKWRA